MLAASSQKIMNKAADFDRLSGWAYFSSMPKINLKFDSKLSGQQVYGMVKDFLENDESVKSLESKLVCDFDDTQLSGRAKGGKFTAELKVEDLGQSCKVFLDVDLAFILSPFKGKIEDVLNTKLPKLLT
jgi:hypothetical protein